MERQQPGCSGINEQSNEGFLSDDQCSPDRIQFTYRLRRDNLASNIYRAFKSRVQESYQWISDVIPNVRFEQCETLVKQAIEVSGTDQKKAIAVIWHPECEETQKGHIHCYHSCAYTQSRCRCSFIRGFKLKHKRVRDHFTINTATREYYKNWIEYFTTKPRQILHFQVGLISYRRKICEIRDLRERLGCENYQTDRSMEESFLSCEDINRETGLEASSYSQDQCTSETINRIVGSGYSDNTRSGFEPTKQVKHKMDLNDKIVKQILRILSIPLDSACSTTDWLNDKYLSFYDKKNSDYQLAVSTINRMTTSLSFQQLYEIQTTTGCLQTYHRRFGQHYYSIEESLTHIKQLLEHQYGSNGIGEFVIRLYQILEKEIPKKNTMFVQGEYLDIYV